ncbi:hypothetical protein GJ496_003975 [Pomphorhynchus laevis]|nr:hypothetical protein GJ496_003975 [Pomphorhynchus laevis]
MEMQSPDTKYKVKVLEADEKIMEKSCCFVIGDEDHTLGNALRYVIMKDANVNLCGYTIPHPADETIHLSIQLKKSAPNEVTALHTLNTGLVTLQSVCTEIDTLFKNKVDMFKVKPKNEVCDVQIKEERMSPPA